METTKTSGHISEKVRDGFTAVAQPPDWRWKMEKDLCAMEQILYDMSSQTDARWNL